MKKILVILTLLVFLIPLLVSAQKEIPNCCKIGRTVELEGTTYAEGKYVGGEDTCNVTTPHVATDYKTKKWGLICFLSAVEVATDWIFTFLMTFVGVMIILGAFFTVTAGGSPERQKKGKDFILFAVIGMIVGLLAKAVPSLIGALLG